MSQNENNKKNEQKSTDDWKKKQEEKKKNKQTKSKDQAPPDSQKKQVIQKVQELEMIKNKSQQKSLKAMGKQNSVSTEKKEPLKAIVHKELKSINSLISGKQSSKNRNYQQELVKKYMENYVNSQDTIIYLNNQDLWNCPCEQISIYNFNKTCKQSQLVCRYSDVSYFMEKRVTKVFVEASFIFSNGSLLAKKGCLNIILLAIAKNIPIIGCSGSWNYCQFEAISEELLEEKYGPTVLDQYDFVEASLMNHLVLEIGGILPQQISHYPPQIYTSLNFKALD